MYDRLVAGASATCEAILSLLFALVLSSDAASQGEPGTLPLMSLAAECVATDGDPCAELLRGEPLLVRAVLHNDAAEAEEVEFQKALVAQLAGAAKSGEASGPFEKFSASTLYFVPTGAERWLEYVALEVKKLDSANEPGGEPVKIPWFGKASLESVVNAPPSWCVETQNGSLVEAALVAVICVPPALTTAMTPGTYEIVAEYDTSVFEGVGGAVTPVKLVSNAVVVEVRDAKSVEESGWLVLQQATHHIKLDEFELASVRLDELVGFGDSVCAGQGRLLRARVRQKLGQQSGALEDLKKYKQLVDQGVPGVKKPQSESASLSDEIAALEALVEAQGQDEDK
jgi:hypothetical protein